MTVVLGLTTVPQTHAWTARVWTSWVTISVIVSRNTTRKTVTWKSTIVTQNHVLMMQLVWMAGWPMTVSAHHVMRAPTVVRRSQQSLILSSSRQQMAMPSCRASRSTLMLSHFVSGCDLDRKIAQPPIWLWKMTGRFLQPEALSVNNIWKNLL